MPDNWGFVFAAYGLTAAVLALYWRHLVRKEKDLQRYVPTTGTATATTTRSPRTAADTTRGHTEQFGESPLSDREIAERSRHPSRAGHPRPDPTTRGPLQP